MTMTKLDDLIRMKKPGDVWYSLQAPEPVRFWSLARPWADSFFVGLSLMAVSVKASGKSGEDETHTFDRKHPMYLDCGADVIRGYVSTLQSKSASITLRVDGVKQFNEALKELSAKLGYDQWEVRVMQVYNDAKGIIVEYRVHNPNHSGEALQTWRFQNGDGSKLYPEVSLHYQQEAVGDFYEEYSHCTLVQKTQTIFERDCAKKLRIKSRQTKIRKPSVHVVPGNEAVVL